MIFPKLKVTSFLIAIILGVLYLGSGQEKGDATGKEVESFLLHDIKSTQLIVVNRKKVDANTVPLPLAKKIKHFSKRFLMLIGIVNARESYAVAFTLKVLPGNRHLWCLVRLHGDQVLGIVIYTFLGEHNTAVHLQRLMTSAFPDYEIRISSLPD